MADRYPNEDYGRDGSRGRFSRSERWGDDDDWRRGRRQGGRFSSEYDDDDRRGYGGYGGGYGQGMSGNYAGGYDRNRRDWDDEFGQGGMRGQSYGAGGYDRDEWDRSYGLQGSGYSQQGQRLNQGPSGQGYGGYSQGGQSYGGSRTRYGQTGTGNWGQGSEGGYSAQGNWGQGGGMSGDFGQEYGEGQNWRGAQQGYGGYGANQPPTGGFGNQTGFNEGGSFGQGRPGMGGQGYSSQDFGGYEGSFGQGGSFGQSRGFGSEQSGSYLTRGGRQQWGRHSGRGPKNYTRSDDRIREDVNDRLTDDPHIDASEIDVKVSNCEVTLTGTVESRDEKRRAEDCAEAVSGVKNVQNNLRVQPQGQRSGEDEMTRTGAGKKNKSGGDTEQRVQ